MTRLTCREAVEFLADYLDHGLDAAQQQAFEQHLALCDECVAYLKSYEQTVRLGRATFDDLDAAADAHLPRELVTAIAAARRRDSQ
jgi:anti-sigma factor RsiW